MKILITAGGTSERIDDVRRITNLGTGRLGALIADGFASSGHDIGIDYICSANAARPASAHVSEHICDDVSSVRDTVIRLCTQTAYGAIVHSMAISDYVVKAVNDGLHSSPDIREAKISSGRERLVIVLEKAPKIIALLRGLAPGAVIVGFKLLSGADETGLVCAGHELLTKVSCDFVLANDMETVSADRHEGLLIAQDGSFDRALGKADIAALIVKRVFERAVAR